VKLVTVNVKTVIQKLVNVLAINQEKNNIFLKKGN
jgi:hypothetical protein